MVQLSHPYMTTGKTIALTRRTFVGKVMSLLFNMLSRLVITFLPRSKHLLISWLQPPSAVILEPPKIKSTVSPSISHEVMRPDAMTFVFWMLALSQLFHFPQDPSESQSKLNEHPLGCYLIRMCNHKKSQQLVNISYCQGSSQPRNGTCVSCIGRQILYCWAAEEAHILTENYFNFI